MRKLTLILSLLLVCGIVFAVRAAKPTKKGSSTTRPAGARLFAPYSKMTTLEDAQRTKIHELHRKVLAEKHDLDAKEEADILALLNDDQKKELRAIEEKSATDEKTKPAPKEDADK